jgi:DDE family transposase
VRALNTLRRALEKRLEFMHAKTERALWRGVAGVVSSGQLWLTALGRGFAGQTTAKHRIKAADRLLGSENLHCLMLDVYRAAAEHLLSGLERPCISVDWTGVGPHHHVLTASLSFQGRALPIFSRVYPDSKKHNATTAKRFLRELATVVPKSCTPVLLTDAGFHHWWFDEVLSLGWDYIGRFRGKVCVRVNGAWRPLAWLHGMAGQEPQCLGVVPANRKDPRNQRVVLSSRRVSKGRKRLNLKGSPRRDSNSKRAIQAAREPWVLPTSLECSPKKIVALYAQRMQIEESFRDLKSHRFGWSLVHVRSKSQARIEVLLLLATLAMIIMHCIGLAAERARFHFAYQANTVRNKRVFSTFFLARLVLRHGHAARLKPDDLSYGIATFRSLLFHASDLTSE